MIGLELVPDRHFHFSSTAARAIGLADLAKGGWRRRIERESVPAGDVAGSPGSARAEIYVVEYVERGEPELQALPLRTPRHDERLVEACVCAEVGGPADGVASAAKSRQREGEGAGQHGCRVIENVRHARRTVLRKTRRNGFSESTQRITLPARWIVETVADRQRET